MKTIETCKYALLSNRFDVFVAKDTYDAKQIFFDKIFLAVKNKIVSWGDSITLSETGIIENLLKMQDIEVIRTFESGIDRRIILERRRQALLSDLFLTGSNAITECGKLVNLDMIGNRVGAITFGPKKVVIFVGKNKITSDLSSAFARIKNISAPLNAKRHNLNTPCVKTGKCADCGSSDRICNYWSVIDKSFPKGRIKVVLINENLGL